MLRMVGLAVAMGNASPQLKAEAHYVTASNDQDGLAHAVEWLVLKPGLWCWD
jgi:hydroxymethylpyrimidine pyrophosphatase-like HAD family hydrolase